MSSATHLAGKLSIPCESPKGLEAFVETPGATTPIGPLRVFSIAKFISEVMEGSVGTGSGAGAAGDVVQGKGLCHALNGSEVEARYVFNTMEQCVLEADFEVPALIRSVTDMPGGYRQVNPTNRHYNPNYHS
jgi:hypothetical protein